tara:strand:+ start:1219 stop:1407 length:189 start_codon:yes stop_codon:yes gene_type:complete
MEYIQQNWEQILAIVTGVIAAASAVAVLTPNKTDNKVVGAIRKLVDLLALNVGNAKNEKSKK